MAKKKQNLFLAIILVIGSCITVGCETYENVGGGGLLGAGLGAGIGALAGDPALGAAIGGGVGLAAGLAKDNMEIKKQNRANQAQTNAQLLQMQRDAEIQRQVGILKERGYTPDQYRYRTGTTASGMIYVDPVKKEAYAQTEIIR
ncbi:MAG: hypothetical protein ISR98_00895 [Parcubacteria group bacterium]|nr:hypothetical protein [Parcubacteria group bacterium]